MEPIHTFGFRKKTLSISQGNLQKISASEVEIICGGATEMGLNFRREGFSPKYLKIDGQWRDHERYALCARDYEENINE